MMDIDAVVQAEFLKMNIPHPRMAKAHRVYDNLRQMKVLVPHKPQRCACLFAPTQSGKSKTVETYIETQVVDEVIKAGLFSADIDRSEIARRQKLALHVTLDGKATPKNLASAILSKFGDPQAATGTTSALLGRVADYMDRWGTQILFLDEIQHLDDRQTEKNDKPKRASIYLSTAVTDTLKTMLIRGLIPIVFIGLDESENMILGDPQLSGRCLSKIEFDSLRPEVVEEQGIFLDYLGMLGIKLKLPTSRKPPPCVSTGSSGSACCLRIPGDLRAFMTEFILTAEITQQLESRDRHLRWRDVPPLLRTSGLEPVGATHGKAGLIWRRAEVNEIVNRVFPD